ncbi:uncharacterized protein J3D65DRAFT_607465 [Phyllosticta citribraziliensis]|uniref:Uncharacterized protein n=1 Tax=Phyllosticta citribraziliensis TaxID=989973 RepID=A0ABR1L3F1_9PEZI
MPSHILLGAASPSAFHVAAELIVYLGNLSSSFCIPWFIWSRSPGQGRGHVSFSSLAYQSSNGGSASPSVRTRESEHALSDILGLAISPSLCQIPWRDLLRRCVD